MTTAAIQTCNHCRRRPAAPDRRRCRPCLDKAAANSRKRYARLAARAACTRCGQRPPCPANRAVPPARTRRRNRGRGRSAPGTSRPSARCEFGPYGDEIEAHADAAMRRIEPRFGEYAVYARTVLDGTPDLDDIRTRLSFEIG